MTRHIVPFLGVLVAASACSPERLRPGPPSLSIEVPQGSTVSSPDTLPLRVVAMDPNGLAFVDVTFLGATQPLDFSNAEVEVTTVLNWPIPADLDPGTVLTIIGRAEDLTGAATVREASVTVVGTGNAMRATR